MKGGSTMSQQRKASEGNTQTVRLWTFAEAIKVEPYIASLMRSVREYRLEALRLGLAARRLADRPGRPDRKAILRQQEIVTEANRAEDNFHEALQELQDLDIYCLDPNQGLALVPFMHDHQLAWFVYDMFDSQPFRTWRYHSDALEVRRPIAEVLHVPAENTLSA